jgi:hypothetical protein
LQRYDKKTHIHEHELVRTDAAFHLELDHFLLRHHSGPARLGLLLLPPLLFLLVLHWRGWSERERQEEIRIDNAILCLFLAKEKHHALVP